MAYKPRTVIHGIDQSVPYHTNLPDHGEGKGPAEGAQCFDEELMAHHVYSTGYNKWYPMEYVAFEYDFREDGGSLGFHNLGIVIPEGTVMIGGVCDVVDPVQGGATSKIRISIDSSGDVLTATAIASFTEGLLAVVPVYSAASGIKCSRDQQVKVEVIGAPVTMGHFYVYLTSFRSSPSDSTSSSSSSSSSGSSGSSSSGSSTSASSLSSSSSQVSSHSASSSSNSSSSSASASSSSSASLSSSSSVVEQSSSSGGSSPSTGGFSSSSSSQSASSSHSISSSSLEESGI